MTPDPSSNPQPTAMQQRRQANRLLIRLQWLMIFLLLLAVVWLYIDQQQFEQEVSERLQMSEQMATKLGEMDDRLYAISQQSITEPIMPSGNQAQNQLDLFKIQIQAADRLLADDNYSATIELLRGLEWQLSQSSNEIAPALSIVLKQSIKDDIKRLQAQSSQPSTWQLQNIAIQNIQAFLHSYERINNQNNTGQAHRAGDNLILSRRQLTIHEVIMTLNLAMQASNMREHDQLTSYLRAARDQLKTVAPTTKNRAKTAANNQAQAMDDSNQAKRSAINTVDTPKDIAEVIIWLDKLIAHAPKPKPLLTAQIVEQSQ